MSKGINKKDCCIPISLSLALTQKGLGLINGSLADFFWEMDCVEIQYSGNEVAPSKTVSKTMATEHTNW